MVWYATAFRMTCVSRPFQHPIFFHGRKKCLNLEDALWLAFRQLAAERRQTFAALLEQIERESDQPFPSMSSRVRNYLVADLIRRVR
jgi:predicted DNA-binding ribbon-helix-helix protein